VIKVDKILRFFFGGRGGWGSWVSWKIESRGNERENSFFLVDGFDQKLEFLV
jgi:hypothetical protein